SLPHPRHIRKINNCEYVNNRSLLPRERLGRGSRGLLAAAEERDAIGDERAILGAGGALEVGAQVADRLRALALLRRRQAQAAVAGGLLRVQADRLLIRGGGRRRVAD